MAAWEKEEVFHSGDLFFRALLLSIQGAKKSVDFETYILERGLLADRVFLALEAAAGRGVRVRLLLDGAGCSQWNFSQIEDLRTRGIEVKIYHPLPWQVSGWRFLQSFGFRRLLKILGRLNRRNHRKAVVIDEATAFVGGMNVTDKHLSEFYGKDAWRDTSVMVRGDGVSRLVLDFDHLWSRRRAKPRPESHGPVRLNSGRRARRRLYFDLVQRVFRAERRVWITTPYFVPEPSLARALRFAAWNGVDVRILVPRKNDVWLVKWIARAFYWILMRYGAKVYEYLPSVLHAKILLIDDWGMVGSSNMNHRSILHDLEVDLELAEAESLRSLENQFRLDLLSAHPIEPSVWRKRSWLGRLFERLVVRLKHWV